MANSIEKELLKRKKARVKWIIILSVLVLGTYIALHICTAYNSDPRATINSAIDAGLLQCVTAPFRFRVNGTNCACVFGVAAVLIAAIAMHESNKELKKHDNPDTVNGEAHLMNAEELALYQTKYADPIGKPGIDGSNNMILSKDIRLAIDGFATRRNCNVLCIGGSGAGKSRYFAAPNILQFNANFVITDPSGELLHDYGKALEDMGYAVKVFNLTNVYESNHYNPFAYITSEKDVFTLVETLIKNTTPKDAHSSDPIWENGERLLLDAIILYLWHTRPETEQNFTKVTELINLAQIDENDASVKSSLDKMFDELEAKDPDNLAVRQYKTFKLAAGKTLKSFLISVGTRIQKFQLADIKYLTSTDDLDLKKFADSRQALFVVIPTEDTTFNFIVSLMYSQLFASLYDYSETRAKYASIAKIGQRNIIRVEQARNAEDADRAKQVIKDFVREAKKGTKKVYNEDKKYWELRVESTGELIAWRGTEQACDKLAALMPKLKQCDGKRKCPIHVRLILDEFANIGQIPGFAQKLSTIRKYEISCSIILQALSQLKTMYKDDWNTIAANCDTKLFLGCDDSETIEWLVKMLGKKTTTTMSTSYQAGNTGGSTSYQKSSLEIMTIDQVTMMQDNECLVRIRGVRPYYGRKYELTEHPNYEYSKRLAGGFKIPISEETKERIARMAGPLRERRLGNGLAAAAESTEHPISSESTRERNERIKKAAERAKQEATDAFSSAAESASLSSAGATSIKEVLARFCCNENSSDEEILEAVETVLDIPQPPEAAVKWMDTE